MAKNNKNRYRLLFSFLIFFVAISYTLVAAFIADTIKHYPLLEFVIITSAELIIFFGILFAVIQLGLWFFKID